MGTAPVEAEEGPAWLASELLQYGDQLQLSPEQRVRLESIRVRAQAAWRELSVRLVRLDSARSEAERADWAAVARERGRLRILADRDALLVLEAPQRERWRLLHAHSVATPPHR